MLFMKQLSTYLVRIKYLPWRQITGLICILLVGLCFWLDQTQNNLADKMLRLHVLANSDTAEDQALKLKVRDGLLAQVQPWLDEEENIGGVKESLRSHVPELTTQAEQIVQAAGYDYPVRVAVEETWFPTREYDGFALPAGHYEALRVFIGEGAGQNWWCVVFPPLCLSASSETITKSAEQAGLEDQEVFLILEDDDEYVIKFRAIELWEKLKHCFE